MTSLYNSPSLNGFVAVAIRARCINCNCELSSFEIEKGEGWCFDCLLPDGRLQ